MYIDSEMVYYLQQISAQFQSHQKKMAEMNRLIKQLQQDVAQLRNSAVPPVVRNEYKFDLLKVEKLEGTLSIGLHPNGKESSIEELAVNQGMEVPAVYGQDQDLFDRVRQQVNHYLDHAAFSELESIEHKYGYPLDETYRKFIVDDVKKQIDKRIRHYLQQVKMTELEPEQLDYIEQATCKKVKNDIEKTFEAFLKNLPRRENER